MISALSYAGITSLGLNPSAGADPASQFDRCTIRLMKDHHIFSSVRCQGGGGGGGWSGGGGSIFLELSRFPCSYFSSCGYFALFNHLIVRMIVCISYSIYMYQ